MCFIAADFSVDDGGGGMPWLSAVTRMDSIRGARTEQRARAHARTHSQMPAGVCAWIVPVPTDSHGEAADRTTMSPLQVPKKPLGTAAAAGAAAAPAKLKLSPPPLHGASGAGGGGMGEAACAGDFCGCEWVRSDDGVVVVATSHAGSVAPAALSSVSAKTVLLARRCSEFVVRVGRCALVRSI